MRFIIARLLGYLLAMWWVHLTQLRKRVNHPPEHLVSSGISISIDRYFINCFFFFFMLSIGYKSNCIFLNIKSQQQRTRSWTTKFCNINLIVNTNILYKYLNYVTNTPSKKMSRRSRGRKISWSLFIYFNSIHFLLLFF